MNIDIKLNGKEVDSFLALIKVDKSINDIAFLNRIIAGIFHTIPFQNLTLLNAKKRPDDKQIVKDMLLGIGGLCNTRNRFVYILLKTLGFKVHFLSATIMQPECHIILLICINDEKYMVDTGNGFPYLSAINLNENKIFSHPYMQYRVIKDNLRFYMQHKKNTGDWKNNYHFNLETVAFSSFYTMLDKQYSEIGWGPFTTIILINKWSLNGGVIIRNKLCLALNKNSVAEKYPLKTLNDFKQSVKHFFPDNNFVDLVDIDNAWKLIN